MKKYFDNKNRLRAFTILEMLIVMGVIVLVMGLSVYGVTRFRYSIELQNGYSDVLTYIQNVENKARNSVSSPALYDSTGSYNQSVPDYYVMHFENNNYSLLACNVAGSSLVCYQEEANVKADRFNNVLVNSTCEYIGIQKRNVDFVEVEPIGFGINNDGECLIVVSHESVPTQFEITLDLVSNKIYSE